MGLSALLAPIQPDPSSPADQASHEANGNCLQVVGAKPEVGETERELVRAILEDVGAATRLYCADAKPEPPILTKVLFHFKQVWVW